LAWFFCKSLTLISSVAEAQPSQPQIFADERKI
jgi:hypothetical protein